MITILTVYKKVVAPPVELNAMKTLTRPERVLGVAGTDLRLGPFAQ